MPGSQRKDAASSDSISYALTFLWSGDTLHVNGRFQRPKQGDWRRFGRYATIASMNNRGERTDAGYLLQMAWGRLTRRSD
jgi:hypothetical protein